MLASARRLYHHELTCVVVLKKKAPAYLPAKVDRKEPYVSFFLYRTFFSISAPHVVAIVSGCGICLRTKC